MSTDARTGAGTGTPVDPSAGISLGDRERLSLHVQARRVPRQSWAPLHDAHTLIEDANTLWRSVRTEVGLLRANAAAEGREQGRAEAVAEMARHLADAHSRARGLIDAQDARVIDLASALVARILPHLHGDAAVRGLLTQALQAQQSERSLTVRVHPSMHAAAAAQVETWRATQAPPPTVHCLADPTLDVLGLVVESEQGSLHAGVLEQLQALTGTLHRSVAQG